MKTKLYAILALGLMTLTTACEKNYITQEIYVGGNANTDGGNSDNTETVTEDEKKVGVKEVELEVGDYSKFIYFSFEKGKQLEISDEQSKTSKSWDLGIHRGDFRTNSGKSTSKDANGGAYETESKDITENVAIPSPEKFVVDSLLVITTGHTDEAGVLGQEWLPANLLLSTVQNPVVDEKGQPVIGDSGFPKYEIKHRGAIVRDFSRMPPVAELSKKVYLVRTPNGKFAKIQITFYQSKGPKATLRMKYVYPVGE